MTAVDVRSPGGATVGAVHLDETIFGIQPNVPVMHQVVTAQLAARRAGTQSTLTRAEVAGGGAKPWRQKGTGRARQGSTNAPHWRGGGVAFAPKPRSYKHRTPKKMVTLALRSALSDRAADGRIVVVDEWRFDAPKTKDAVAALNELGIEGRALIVLGDGEHDVWKSFRNLQGAHCILASELNTYDVLVADYIVFTRATLPGDVAEAEVEVSIATDEDEGDEPVEDDGADDADATDEGSASDEPQSAEAGAERRPEPTKSTDDEGDDE